MYLDENPRIRPRSDTDATTASVSGVAETSEFLVNRLVSDLSQRQFIALKDRMVLERHLSPAAFISAWIDIATDESLRDILIPSVEIDNQYLQDLQDLFAQVDYNRDGYVTWDEFSSNLVECTATNAPSVTAASFGSSDHTNTSLTKYNSEPTIVSTPRVVPSKMKYLGPPFEKIATLGKLESCALWDPTTLRTYSDSTSLAVHHRRNIHDITFVRGGSGPGDTDVVVTTASDRCLNVYRSDTLQFIRRIYARHTQLCLIGDSDGNDVPVVFSSGTDCAIHIWDVNRDFGVRDIVASAAAAATSSSKKKRRRARGRRARRKRRITQRGDHLNSSLSSAASSIIPTTTTSPSPSSSSTLLFGSSSTSSSSLAATVAESDPFHLASFDGGQEAHDDFVVELLLLRDLSLLLSGSLDCTIKLWDTRKRICKYTKRGHRQGVTCLSYSDSYKILVSSGTERHAYLWNTLETRPMHVLEGHRRPLVGSVAVPDVPEVITADQSGVVMVWDIRAMKKTPVQVLKPLIPKTLRRYVCLCYNPLLRQAIVSGLDNCCYWDSVEATNKDHLQAQVVKIIHSRIFKQILLLTPRMLVQWTAISGIYHKSFVMNRENNVNDFVIVIKKRHVCCGSVEGELKLYNLVDGTLKEEMTLPGRPEILFMHVVNDLTSDRRARPNSYLTHVYSKGEENEPKGPIEDDEDDEDEEHILVVAGGGMVFVIEPLTLRIVEEYSLASRALLSVSIAQASLHHNQRRLLMQQQQHASSQRKVVVTESLFCPISRTLVFVYNNRRIECRDFDGHLISDFEDSSDVTRCAVSESTGCFMTVNSNGMFHLYTYPHFFRVMNIYIPPEQFGLRFVDVFEPTCSIVVGQYTSVAVLDLRSLIQKVHDEIDRNSIEDEECVHAARRYLVNRRALAHDNDDHDDFFKAYDLVEKSIVRFKAYFDRARYDRLLRVHNEIQAECGPWLLAFRSSFVQQREHHDDIFGIVYEAYDSTLEDYIANFRDDSVKTSDVMNVLSALVNVLSVLHAHHYVAGNITCSNVVRVRGTWKLKLTDCVVVEAPYSWHEKRFNSRLHHLDPALVRIIVRKLFVRREVLAIPTHDIWSLGTVILRMVDSSFYPYHVTPTHLSDFVTSTDFSSLFDEMDFFQNNVAMLGLMKKLLEKDRHERWTIGEVEDFVTEYHLRDDLPNEEENGNDDDVYSSSEEEDNEDETKNSSSSSRRGPKLKRRKRSHHHVILPQSYLPDFSPIRLNVFDEGVMVAQASAPNHITALSTTSDPNSLLIGHHDGTEGYVSLYSLPDLKLLGEKPKSRRWNWEDVPVELVERAVLEEEHSRAQRLQNSLRYTE